VPTQPQNPIPSNDVFSQTSQNPISSNNASHQTPKKLFVGGVARETTRETFNEFFESYGKMSDCILMFRDGRSRCFGFVTYEEVSSMNRVLVSKIELDGKVLDVKIAVPAEKVAPDSYGRYSRSEHDSNRTCKVFVGGLPKEVELEELKNHFAQFGEMVDAFIVKNKETKESRGFGFVIYNREEEVDKVLAYTNHVLGGKEVNCRKAKAKERERDAAVVLITMTNVLHHHDTILMKIEEVMAKGKGIMDPVTVVLMEEMMGTILTAASIIICIHLCFDMSMSKFDQPEGQDSHDITYGE